MLDGSQPEHSPSMESEGLALASQIDSIFDGIMARADIPHDFGDARFQDPETKVLFSRYSATPKGVPTSWDNLSFIGFSGNKIRVRRIETNERKDYEIEIVSRDRYDEKDSMRKYDFFQFTDRDDMGSMLGLFTISESGKIMKKLRIPVKQLADGDDVVFREDDSEEELNNPIPPSAEIVDHMALDAEHAPGILEGLGMTVQKAAELASKLPIADPE